METKTSLPTSLKLTLALLFGLTLASLGLSLYLAWSLRQARAQVVTTLQQAKPAVAQAFEQLQAGLQEFEQSTLTFEVQIDQALPIQTEIPFNENINIPVELIIPVREEVETTVMIDAFQSGFLVPVDMAVPIELDFPISQTVSINVERTVPISTTVPLSLTVPIAINIQDTDLAPYLQELRQGLNRVEASINQTLSEIEPE